MTLCGQGKTNHICSELSVYTKWCKSLESSLFVLKGTDFLVIIYRIAFPGFLKFFQKYFLLL